MTIVVKFLVSPDLNALPKYEGVKFLKDSFEKVNDSILSEEALQININDEPFTVIMRTPFQENDMVRGLMFCEDIYTLWTGVIYTNGLASYPCGNISYRQLF